MYSNQSLSIIPTRYFAGDKMPTAYIVGKGPSLLHLRAHHISDGDVITLNHAILAVRRLALRNPLYVMQKDGCRPASEKADPFFQPPPEGHECSLIRPRYPEVALFSFAESRWCHSDYRDRGVFNIEREFGLHPFTPSAVVAVYLAYSMGNNRVVFVSHDGYTLRDERAVVDGETAAMGDDAGGYWQIGDQARQAAERLGMAVEWLTPCACGIPNYKTGY